MPSERTPAPYLPASFAPDAQDPNHSSTAHLDDTLDESTYSGGGMGDDHPIAWYHEFDGGRSWHTAGGHTSASYNEPDFLQHLAGGIEYAIGTEPDDPTPPTTTPPTTSPTVLPSIDRPDGTVGAFV